MASVLRFEESYLFQTGKSHGTLQLIHALILGITLDAILSDVLFQCKTILSYLSQLKISILKLTWLEWSFGCTTKYYWENEKSTNIVS
jgi:hypothetical protein